MSIPRELRIGLLKVAWWCFVVCAVIAAGWMVFEWFRLAQSIADRAWDFRFARAIGLVLVNLLFTGALAVVAVVYLWGRLANALPDPKPWHLEKPESEFRASDAVEGFGLDDYLRQEEEVFRELATLVAGPWSSETPPVYCRYSPSSACDPEQASDRNWNRSFVLEADDPIGGVLLLHGLSDSPYSLRAFGQRLHAEGYTVVWLRLPGHGTSPCALANVSWQDWTAAVQLAMKGLRARLPLGAPILMGGYSNGGALTVHYTLSAIADSELPKPSGVVLFSPMIGISPLARITSLYYLVALVFRNQKAQWSNIAAEIDPFRFSSWPMNASVQAWRVTQVVEKQLASLEKAGRMHELPPVLTVQSVVDSTVVVPKLITALFDRLVSPFDELLLFDINRLEQLANLFNKSFEKKVFPILDKQDLPYKLTILKNETPDSPRLVMRTCDGTSRSDTTTDLQWPPGFASLSHIAVPFPPDDPIYGTREATEDGGLSIGTMTVRAEPSALLLSASLFCRSRHNPFYKFTEDHIVCWLDRVLERSEVGN